MMILVPHAPSADITSLYHTPGSPDVFQHLRADLGFSFKVGAWERRSHVSEACLGLPTLPSCSQVKQLSLD